MRQTYEDQKRWTGLAYRLLPVPESRCDAEPNILTQWAWVMRKGVKTEDNDHPECESLECRDCLVMALVFSAPEVKRADGCWVLGWQAGDMRLDESGSEVPRQGAGYDCETEMTARASVDWEE